MAETIIWTQKDCPLCGRVKAELATEGYEERNVADLLSGLAPNDDALAQLALQNMRLPLVMIDGRFVPVDQILARSAAA